MGVKIRAGRHNLSTDRFLFGRARQSVGAVRPVVDIESVCHE